MRYPAITAGHETKMARNKAYQSPSGCQSGKLTQISPLGEPQSNPRFKSTISVIGTLPDYWNNIILHHRDNCHRSQLDHTSDTVYNSARPISDFDPTPMKPITSTHNPDMFGRHSKDMAPSLRRISKPPEHLREQLHSHPYAWAWNMPVKSHLDNCKHQEMHQYSRSSSRRLDFSDPYRRVVITVCRL